MSYDRQAVLVAIAGEMDIPISELTDDMSVLSLGDSLELVTLVCSLEDQFGIEISDAEIDNLETLQDVLEMVKRHVEPTTSTGTSDEATTA